MGWWHDKYYDKREDPELGAKVPFHYKGVFH